MDKDNIQVAVTVVMGAAYLYFLYKLYTMSQQDVPEFPTTEQMLKAVENGAANLTVTPLTVSDN